MRNRLGDASSLYLRQHAGNPVAWQPWDAKALALARERGVPVLLSIGYSACHWCHVMAHESFEDEAIGALINELYVPVKVDREERPDLDHLYQLAHQALARRSGGWPLTVFIDPHTLLPFFAGTYFPTTPRHGLPGFSEVLRSVRRWWDEEPDQVQRQNQAMREFLASSTTGEAHAGELDDTPVRLARQRLESMFDAEHGGNRGAPKFPDAGALELLSGLARGGDAGAAAMLEATLAGMGEGGLHDHLGGGFFRYCVDAAWTIPHFEKMLYDTALLLPLYADFAATDPRRERARAVADRTVAWLREEMLAPDGGLCSALDADSEGGEGAYYVWTREQVSRALDPDEEPAVALRFGLDGPPNFEQHRWHLVAARTPLQVAQALDRDLGEVSTALERARQVLLQHRRTRPPPARDDKRLTAWNALAMAALARAGRVLEDRACVELAFEIGAFLRSHAFVDGALHASHAGGRTHFPGYLDDHAFLLDAAIELLAARWDAGWLALASELAATLTERFQDREHGGFWFTAHDHEKLPQRAMHWYDRSTPSGNAVAVRALQRLGWLLAEPRWIEAAERALRAGWEPLVQTPEACPTLVRALAEHLAPPPLIVLRTRPHEHAPWRQLMRGEALHGALCFGIPHDAAHLPAALAGKRHLPGGVAYLCRGTRCLPPARTPEALVALLETG
ncbi:MAG TPA: thioredoxin domain-containing protein [Xanthomonadaceae bacterium]|nr:thioredoxin domain-containing protein [Xanthomonadaceae bacterium]